MLSAKAISAAIKAKKKKMEDEAGAVKLSGIPEDAQDIMVNKNHEEGERLSENYPKERDEDPSLDSLVEADASGAEHESEEPESDEMKMRKAKKMALIAKMGR